MLHAPDYGHFLQLEPVIMTGFFTSLSKYGFTMFT